MPLAPEVIEARTKKVEVFNSVKDAPDIIEYKKRQRQRKFKRIMEVRQVLNARRKKALQPAIIATMAEGTPPTQVAKKLRLSQNTVKAVITDPSFNRALTAYQNETLTKARDILIEATQEASLKVANCMRKGRGSQKLQFIAAQDILTRCNVEMPKVTQSVTRQYSPEETDSMLKTLKEATAILETVAVQKSPYLIDKATPQTQKAPSGPTS